MYIKLLGIVFLMLAIDLRAQNSNDSTRIDTLQMPDVFPAFPGGAIEWQKFLQRNLNPEVPVDFGALGGQYIVKVKFIVDVDGTVSSIEPVTKLGFVMETEVIRVIQKSGKWEPGLLNGKPIKTYMVQAVIFRIDDGE